MPVLGITYRLRRTWKWSNTIIHAGGSIGVIFHSFLLQLFCLLKPQCVLRILENACKDDVELREIVGDAIGNPEEMKRRVCIHLLMCSSRCCIESIHFTIFLYAHTKNTTWIININPVTYGRLKRECEGKEGTFCSPKLGQQYPWLCLSASEYFNPSSKTNYYDNLSESELRKLIVTSVELVSSFFFLPYGYL